MRGIRFAWHYLWWRIWRRRSHALWLAKITADCQVEIQAEAMERASGLSSKALAAILAEEK